MQHLARKCIMVCAGVAIVFNSVSAHNLLNIVKFRELYCYYSRC